MEVLVQKKLYFLVLRFFQIAIINSQVKWTPILKCKVPIEIQNNKTHNANSKINTKSDTKIRLDM